MARADFDHLIARMKKALSLPFSTHSFEDMVADLREGRMQCFWNDDAVIVTEICTTPRRKFLNIFLAAGSLAGCFALEKQLREFAAQNGLSTIQGICRMGWAPVLKKAGWKKQSETWAIDLGEKTHG